MNLELALKIIARIPEERFNMHVFADGMASSLTPAVIVRDALNGTDCNTAGCFAGYIVCQPEAEPFMQRPGDPVEHVAGLVLEMNAMEVAHVFYMGNWPTSLQNLYKEGMGLDALRRQVQEVHERRMAPEQKEAIHAC